MKISSDEGRSANFCQISSVFGNSKYVPEGPSGAPRAAGAALARPQILSLGLKFSRNFEKIPKKFSATNFQTNLQKCVAKATAHRYRLLYSPCTPQIGPGKGPLTRVFLKPQGGAFLISRVVGPLPLGLGPRAPPNRKQKQAVTSTVTARPRGARVGKAVSRVDARARPTWAPCSSFD